MSTRSRLVSLIILAGSLHPAAALAQPAVDATADEDELADEEDPARPPPKGRGVVWGVLTDTKLNEPLVEATVTVVGTKTRVYTDLDGRFRLELPTGTYTLRVFYELHKPRRLERVTVTAGQVTRLDATLEPEEDQGDVIEVEAEVDRAGLAGVMLKRQRSAAMGDGLGRQEIGKTPDSNAAEAARRIPGATLVDGKYVYVRGLGERYSNSLLDGAPIPSPEPDRNAVPLDLFPSLVIDNLTIAKTFTPDMPGDFAGGSVQLETRAIPSKFFFNASFDLGFNTETTFRDRLDYEGSRSDWLGFDGGARQLRSSVPRRYRLTPLAEKPDGSQVLPDELNRRGPSLNSSMAWRESVFTPPNFSVKAVGGDGFDLGKGQKLGVLAAVSYGRGWQSRSGTVRDFVANSAEPRGYWESIDFAVRQTEESVKWSTLGVLTYDPGKNHRLRLLGLRSQLADDKTRLADGFVRDRGRDASGVRLEYISRALTTGRLSGLHQFPDLGNAALDWFGMYSLATRDQPDTRDFVMLKLDSGDLAVASSPEATRHFFSKQAERALVGGANWEQPFDDAKVKLGTLVSQKSRDFAARRFFFRPNFGAPNGVFSCPSLEPSCPDSVLTNSAVSSDAYNLDENTQRADAYAAELNVYAGYLMAEADVHRKLRAVVGQRLERTVQTIEPRNPLRIQQNVQGADLRSTDLLPSAGLIYSATEQVKVRGAVTRTLARPQLRELAPFTWDDFFGGRTVNGFADLRLTKITNADLRFEYFPKLEEVLAGTLFYKRFEDPIEPTLFATSGAVPYQSWRNTPGADLVGVEFDARKGLEFLSRSLREFTVIGNLTLAYSRIELEQTGVGTLTTLSRPLVNQPPWVLNLSLDYANEQGTQARVLYNVSGRQIVEVGTEGIPDAYLHPRHMVDVVVAQRLATHFEVKASVENVLNAEYLVTQGEDPSDEFSVRERWKQGTTFVVGASYTY